MMADPLIIWRLGDGKPGHENQTLGVAEAIERRINAEIHRIGLEMGRSMPGRLLAVYRAVANLPRPDFVFGAGHATHLPLLLLARRTGGRSVVFMKPTLPMAWFDCCIAPHHDFPDGFHHPKLLKTHGAPHRVVPRGMPRTHGLVLLGGPVDAVRWNAERMTACLDEIFATGSWVAGSSRRTPPEWFGSLDGRWANVNLVPHTETGPDWVDGQMETSDPVWVTEDSFSMISEAAGSGARVGILPMPGARTGGRVQRGVDYIVEAGYATRFEEWKSTGALAGGETPLLEADRCAEWILRA